MIRQLNQYTLTEKLGSGGMGEVYKGFDTVLERNVAVKLMHPHLLEDTGNDERFMQEARLLARSVHPNIVTIHEIGKVESGRYIVMEYVKGMPLTCVLKKDGAFGVARAAKVTIQILSGLQHAHKMNILHRDIKSENILVEASDYVKILDFGVAQMMTQDNGDRSENVVGTVQYMAPEQLLGDAFDRRCDLYASGVVLYQMLTNRLPFGGETAEAVLFNQLNEKPISPSYYNDEVTQNMTEIVLKAIDGDREKRWQSAEEFAEAIRKEVDYDQAATVGLESYLEDDEYEAEEEVGDFPRQVFIGREDKIKKLITLFRNIEQGQGQTVILMGEAGVGKSTLAKKLRDYARQKDAWVLYGACLYQNGTDAYLPFIDILQAFFNKQRHTLPESRWLQLRDAICRKAPSLMAFGEGLTSDVAHHDTPDRMPARELNLHDGICQFFSILSAAQSTVVILDDIQWADEASLRLFHYLTRLVKEHPMLLVGISRTDRYDLYPDGKPGALVDTLARIRREGNYVQLNLDRLAEKSCAKLIDKLFSPNLFTEEFYAAIYRETKGNPFFVIETLKQVRDEGIISKEKETWRNKTQSFKLSVPDRVEDIFVRRLSGLDESQEEVLQLAAVQGYKFDTSLLAQLLEIKRIHLLKQLHKIERDLQIITSHEQGFQFEHPMLRDLLYDQISPVLRQEYHLMIAEHLQATHGQELGVLTGEVARHLRRAGAHDEAAPLLYDAAVRAFHLKAYKEAALYLEDFQDSLEICGSPLPASISEHELYANLGRSYEECGELPKSIEAYNKLLELGQHETDFPGQAEALLALGRLQGKLSQWEVAYGSYEKCLDIANEYQIAGVRGRALNNIGLLDFHKGRLEEAITRFKATRALDDTECSADEKTSAATNLGIIASIRGAFEEAMCHYNDALDLCQRRESMSSDQARIYHNLAVTYMELARWDEALDAFEKCLAASETMEDKPLRALARMNIGKTLAKQNKDLNRARECSEKALKFFKQADDTLNIAEVYHIWGLIYIALGEYANAEKFLDESINISERHDYKEGLVEASMARACVSLKRGRGSQAVEHLERALPLCQSLNLEAKIEEIQSLLLEAQQTVLRVVKPEEESASIATQG